MMKTKYQFMNNMFNFAEEGSGGATMTCLYYTHKVTGNVHRLDDDGNETVFMPELDNHILNNWIDPSLIKDDDDKEV